MSFTYPCYRKLKKHLGQYDAVVEINELAIRHFIDLADQSGDANNYIVKTSERCGIFVSFTNSRDISHTMAGFYIVSVYQSAELFLNEFRNEYKKITGNNIEFLREQSKLKSIMDILKTNGDYIPSEFDEAIILVFEYYRVIRNSIVHKTIDNNKLEREFQKISEVKGLLKNHYKLDNEPNSSDKICFNDFILFSKVVKDVAFMLCRMGKLTDHQISKQIEISKFNKFNNNLIRKEEAIKKEIRALFGVNNDEVNNIMRYINV